MVNDILPASEKSFKIVFMVTDIVMLKSRYVDLFFFLLNVINKSFLLHEEVDLLFFIRSTNGELHMTSTRKRYNFVFRYNCAHESKFLLTMLTEKDNHTFYYLVIHE